ncbi:putative disease resistance protein at3g14460 [Phtheirospermum japonicum]|uniref:Putative disease resistance protein at3g14460 n=1 Tax=Phtheirospermum japonicum TaxID=374723 RepID=A0A830CUC1_9LAMI|nr:putative disease resistance protein at3g14460 [Phtheirospermum japonicum]
MASKSTLSYEAEKISPRKKSKISLGVEQGINEVESSKVPIPPHVQHCALFLSDCEFEKDKLIQMWIAEECIENEETEIMEDVANLYFNELVSEEVIIPSKFDHLYRQLNYKVNTSKISTWFSKQGNYLRIGEGGLDKISGEALHLVWHCKRLDQTLFDALKNLKHLRTLLILVQSSVLIKHLPNDSFLGLKLLRTLDLSCTHILELPGSIRLLEELRYLDISESPIKRLPESIECLHFLQTLKLRGCFGISSLPNGLGRLINLRHLDLNIVGQLEFMPSGMGNLVKLQTLQAFIVGKNDGCGIKELKNMNDITGSFCISKLENVPSTEEAKKAALSNKKRIDKLELRWQDYGNYKSQDTAEILECLQPHFHLQELQITHYGGLRLPSWISNPSYIDLASITLYKCINCDILPSIGKLPSLKILHIVEMNTLRNINTLFCRDYGIQGSNAFPKLEKLTLENMLNLEEWTELEDGDFPCLSHISLRHCPKLSVLPSFSCLCSLQNLEINYCMQLISLPEGLFPASLESLIVKGCPRINERCLKDGGQDWFKIADVKNVWIDFEKISLD